MAVLVLSGALNGLAYEVSADSASIFNSGETTTLEKELDIKVDGGVNFTGVQNLMDPDNTTNVHDTWEPFFNETSIEGAFQGSGNKEGLFKIPVNNLTTAKVTMAGHYSTSSEVVMSGASEGWIRSPFPSNQTGDLIMEVYHVGNSKLVSLIDGLDSSTSDICEAMCSMYPYLERPDKPVPHDISNPTIVWAHNYTEESTLRHDIDNRSYLWWSFPWYPRGPYTGSYVVVFSYDIQWIKSGTVQFYFSDADVGDDEITKSYYSIFAPDNLAGPLDDDDWVNSTDLKWADFPDSNGSLPIDLGLSMLFTEGMGYGVRGDSLPNTELHFFGDDPEFPDSDFWPGTTGIDFDGRIGQNSTSMSVVGGNWTVWDASMALGINDGITFFDVLDEPFDSANHRLTFTMPFLPPEDPDGRDIMVMTVAVGLDKDLNVHHTGSWTANTQVVNDYVLISGRDGDIPTNSTFNLSHATATNVMGGFGMTGANGTAWGNAYMHNSSIYMEPWMDNRTSFDFFDYSACLMATTFGAPTQDFGTAFWPLGYECADGDEHLDGAEIIQFIMGWSFYNTTMPYNTSTPTYFHEDNHNASGLRYWLHDEAADKEDEWSWLTNSVHYFEDYQNGHAGCDLTPALNPIYLGLGTFWARGPTPSGSCLTPPYVGNGFEEMEDGWPTHINLTYDTVLEKYRQWRPFHTIDLDAGTKAIVNPLSAQVAVTVTVTVEMNGIIFEDMSEYEALSFLRQIQDDCKDIDAADNDYDCYFWITDASAKLNGRTIEWSKLSAFRDGELKELKEYLDVELRKCEEALNDPSGVCGEPALVSWPTRILERVCDALNFQSVGVDTCGIIEYLAPIIFSLLSYLVSRLQYVVAIALEVTLFLMGFFVFSIAVSVIWGGQRLITAAIYGDWEQVKDLASKPNWGLSMAFSPLKMTGVGRMATMLRRR